MNEKYYALYKGDTLVSHGTLEEIHRITGKTMKVLKWLTYPTSRERNIKRKSKNAQLLIEVEAIES